VSKPNWQHLIGGRAAMKIIPVKPHELEQATNIERTIIALAVAVVLNNCLVGCDRKPTSESNAVSSQASEQPPVAKSNTDPVASLRQLASEIPADKAFQWTDEETVEWNSKQGEWGRDDRPTFSFNAESVDVEKTNSLVTPYTGYLVLRVSGDARWPQVRVVLAWQENHWVGRKIEKKSSWGPGQSAYRPGWGEMVTYHPLPRLIMRVVPVEWNLEKTDIE